MRDELAVVLAFSAMAKDNSIDITTSHGNGELALSLYARIWAYSPFAAYLSQATDLISRTFTEDPVIRFMLCDLSDSDRLKYLPDYIHVLLKASMLNDAAFQEANDWSCCAVWMAPGK